MEGELRSLGGEHSNRFVEGNTERDLHRGSALLPCTPQPETLLCQCGWGLSAEAPASEDGPRERTRAGCGETAWRGWAVATKGVRGRSLGLPGRQGFILGDTWGEGQDYHKSFFSCEHSQGTGHRLQELPGQAQVTTTIMGSRGGHGPALPDPRPWSCCPGRTQIAPAPRKSVSKRQALPPSVPGEAKGRCTCTPHIKGIMVSTHWGKRQQASKPKAAPRFQKRGLSRRTWAHLLSWKHQNHN